MRRRITYILTAAMILCLSAANLVSAKVVSDNKAAVANPAVEAGGRHLSPGQPGRVPYSLIGAISAEGRWLTDCVAWPWNFVRGIAIARHSSHRWIAGRQLGERGINWLPPLP